MNPKFSILMCVRNAEKTIENAIQSCMIQSNDDWELLIWDNASTDRSRELIESYKSSDDRIRIFQSDEGVGWPKGTSMLLPHVRGEYVMFLAADDSFSTRYALDMINEVSEKEDEPNIIFVKHRNVEWDMNVSVSRDQNVRYLKYCSVNRIESIRWLTDNWYYNSMFHFIKKEFLDANGIDFFSPYHADNESMTKAVLSTDSFCCVDNCIYTLTQDTSQTRGVVYYDYNAELNRWNILKDELIRSGFYHEKDISPVCYAMLNLGYQVLAAFCGECCAVDRYMNPIDKTDYERYLFIQDMLSSQELNEMHFFSDCKSGVMRLFEKLIPFCFGLFNNSDRKPSETDWLAWLIIGGCAMVDGEAVLKKNPNEEDVRCIKTGLMSPLNKYCYGFELFNDVLAYVSDDESFEICRRYSIGQIGSLKLLCEIKNGMVKQERDFADDMERLTDRFARDLEETRFFLPAEEYEALKQLF